MESHYEKEDGALKQLLQLEHKFREHYALTLKEMLIQKDIIDRMWILSQRYTMLISTGNCSKQPEIYTASTEDVLLQEFNEKLKLLRSSNCCLTQHLDQLRQSCRLFEELCGQLDMSIESPFILGDTFHKPISFFIELVSDLFKYFHAMVLKLKYHSMQLDPADSAGWEEYKTLLEPSLDFKEYLMAGLTYCKCLRTSVCPPP